VIDLGLGVGFEKIVASPSLCTDTPDSVKRRHLAVVRPHIVHIFFVLLTVNC